MSRPAISSRPSARIARTASSSQLLAPVAPVARLAPAALLPRAVRAVAALPRARTPAASTPAVLSAIGGPVAVLAGAHVALRVQREPAQRARRPALADELERPAGESPGRADGDVDPEHTV